MATHVDKSQRLVWLARECCQGLDGRDGVVTTDLAYLIPGDVLDLGRRHGDGPALS